MSTERKGLCRIDINKVRIKSMPLEKTKSKAPTKRANVLQKATNKHLKKPPVYKKSSLSTTLQDLFQDDETPIRKLPYDCLLAIFKYCQSTATLIVLSGVNRSWRKLAQNPVLWRESSFLWTSFYHKLTYLCRSPRRNSPFQYIRTLTITSSNDVQLIRTTYEIERSPFTKVETLNTIHLTLHDILFITEWMPNLTSLHCHDIPVHKKESIPRFLNLAKLNSLKLKFSKPHSLHVPQFKLQQALPDILPSSLKVLEMSNLYDEEEHLITQRDIREIALFRRTGVWTREITPEQVENTLHAIEGFVARKYYFFRSLTNLTSLSLDRISSFTSAIWYNHMAYCSQQLVFISLKGWSGRKEFLDGVVSDDSGLVRFISSLACIQTIVLHDFVCTQDFILGLHKLTEPSNMSYQIEHGESILDYLDKPLYNFSISISRK